MKNDILNKGYLLFSDFMKSLLFRFPELNSKIKDLEILKSDFERSLSNAKVALLGKKHSNTEKGDDYDYNYFTSFVEGNLNQYWQHEYLVKQTPKYKEFIALVSLESWLKVKDLDLIYLNKIYQTKFDNEINLEEFESKISVELPGELNFLETEDSENSILAFLENTKIQLIRYIFETEPIELYLNVRKYLSIEEVGFILKSDEF